jgi:hypothetical protein
VRNQRTDDPRDVQGDEDEMQGTRTAEQPAAPLSGVDVGRLVFARGATHLAIRVDGTMHDLHRARFEGKVPEMRVDGGTVTVRYRPSLHRTTGEITLAGRIPWSIETRFGMSDVDADLEDLELLSWEISGGASKVSARLPRPNGEIRIRIGAGASNIELVRPAGVPVRVHVGGGASDLTIDDSSGSGKIDWRSSDYDELEDRYDIQIGAGASKVSIRT